MKAEPPGQRREAHWQQQLKPRERTSAVPLGTERVLGGYAPCGGSVPPPSRLSMGRWLSYSVSCSPPGVWSITHCSVRVRTSLSCSSSSRRAHSRCSVSEHGLQMSPCISNTGSCAVRAFIQRTTKNRSLWVVPSSFPCIGDTQPLFHHQASKGSGQEAPGLSLHGSPVKKMGDFFPRWKRGHLE